MRYSVEPRVYVKGYVKGYVCRVYVKGYEFMSFARSISNKHGKKLVAGESAADAIKTAFKRAIQKTAQATDDLVDNKIADEITSVSKKSTKILPTIDEDVELATPKKRYVSPKERQQIIDELRLVPKN